MLDESMAGTRGARAEKTGEHGGMELKKLGGKVAVITGAASGIGHASALLFAREGAAVVVADLDPEAGEEAAARVREEGGEAVFVPVDVADSGQVERMVRCAVEAFGRVDVLFNNAGVNFPATVVDVGEKAWQRSLDVNLKGVMLGCRHAIPEMLKAGGGSIINTASMLGLVASPRQAPYSAAKGAVVMLTRQVAIDYAQRNIRVNCLCPSEVNTEMNRRFIEQSPDPAAELRRVLARIPMDRMAEPEEVAAAALFLASDDSSYITGVALPVDGGLTAM